MCFSRTGRGGKNMIFLRGVEKLKDVILSGHSSLPFNIFISGLAIN
jgi:hypothetical protein